MNNKPYPYYDAPQVTSIPQLVTNCADMYKEKIAFRYRQGRFDIISKTYNNVKADCDILSRYIHSKFGEKQKIAIISENSYEWILCFFSIISSGNIAVHIDKDMSVDDIHSIIDRTDSVHAFVSESRVEVVDGYKNISFTSMDDISELLRKNKNLPEIDVEIRPDDVASICVTSGTSGASKLVVVTEENYSFAINAQSKMFKLEGEPMQLLPLHHSFGLVPSMLVVYNYGYTNFIAKSIKSFIKDLHTVRPKALALVPLFVEKMYKQVMDNVRKRGIEKKMARAMKISDFLLKYGIDLRRKLFKDIHRAFGRNLEVIICGGAALRPELVKDFRTWGIEIVQGYGATECTPVIAMNRNEYNRAGSVGIALPGTEIKLSEDGEILVKGPHVMREYYGDPEQTAQTLVDGWYHTGDYGKFDEDNFLYIVGRKKNLIILSNGENVSPEELELEISKDLAVNEVLVYDKDNLIIAEIFPEEEYLGNKEHFDAVVAKINNEQPSYKRIAKVILRDTEFIKNSSKKIVRSKNIT